MATTNITGNGTQTKTFEGLVSVDMFQSISFSAVNILLSITATLGNSLILVSLHKEFSLYPPSKLLYRCLATTDFFGWSCYPASLCCLLDVRGLQTLEFLSIRKGCNRHIKPCIMFSVFVDVDSNKRGPTSRPVIGTEIQKDCNFEAHVYYFSYRLGFMSNRWYMLLSQLPYSHSVQLCRYILLPSYIGRLVHKDFSRSQSSSGEPTKYTEHGAIQKGTTQCSVGAVRFNCLLCTIFYIDHSL